MVFVNQDGRHLMGAILSPNGMSAMGVVAPRICPSNSLANTPLSVLEDRTCMCGAHGHGTNILELVGPTLADASRARDALRVPIIGNGATSKRAHGKCAPRPSRDRFGSLGGVTSASQRWIEKT